MELGRPPHPQGRTRSDGPGRVGPTAGPIGRYRSARRRHRAGEPHPGRRPVPPPQRARGVRARRRSADPDGRPAEPGSSAGPKPVGDPTPRPSDRPRAGSPHRRPASQPSPPRTAGCPRRRRRSAERGVVDASDQVLHEPLGFLGRQGLQRDRGRVELPAAPVRPEVQQIRPRHADQDRRVPAPVGDLIHEVEQAGLSPAGRPARRPTASHGPGPPGTCGRPIRPPPRGAPTPSARRRAARPASRPPRLTHPLEGAPRSSSRGRRGRPRRRRARSRPVARR